MKLELEDKMKIVAIAVAATDLKNKIENAAGAEWQHVFLPLEQRTNILFELKEIISNAKTLLD